jgi:hypothetical protein
VISLELIEAVLEQPGADDAWLNCFDSIGRDERIGRGLFSPLRVKRNRTYPDCVVSAFESKPERIGLLGIIAQELLHGEQADVSKIRIDPGGLESSLLRGAAIRINLGNPGITTAGAEQLAVLTTELGEAASETIENVRRVIAERQLFTRAVAAYFLKLRDLSSATEWIAEQEVLGALSELSRGNSRLDDQTFIRTSTFLAAFSAY